METLVNGYTLEIYEGCFPLSTDSMVLSHFVKLPRSARVLDLGSGCGTLGLLLCAKDSGCHVCGMELEERAHSCALENIARNGLSHRMESLNCDLRTACETITPGSFTTCVSNPPYFPGGPGGKMTGARREDLCPPEALFRAASRALKTGGDFYLVHRPERLAQLCALGSAVGLEAKQLQLIRHREGDPVCLILLQFRKGGKPGLLWQELCLHHRDGTPTPEYNTIYHLSADADL